MKYRHWALAAFLAAATALPVCSQNLVANGSFENTKNSWTNATCNYMSLLAGSTAIPGWTVTSDTVNEIVWAKTPTCDGVTAGAGTFLLDLTGFGADSPNGAVQQTVKKLTAGQQYAFSIAVVGTVPSITVDGVPLTLTPSAPFKKGSTVWTPESGVFTAQSSSALLVIRNPQPGLQIVFIDKVQVVVRALFAPNPLNFQTVTVGTNVSRSATLTNLGPTTLTIASATLTGANSADFATENTNPPCGGSLAAGAKCTLKFSFTPSIAGNETATYSVLVDGIAIPQNLQLTGKGTYVEFTPASLNFGTVARGSSASGSVTLTNLGTTALLISQATLTGVNKADFASGNSNPPCGGSVPAGGTCTLTFTFTPSISGNETATYNVYDNDGASPQKLTLTGKGQ